MLTSLDFSSLLHGDAPWSVRASVSHLSKEIVALGSRNEMAQPPCSNPGSLLGPPSPPWDSLLSKSQERLEALYSNQATLPTSEDVGTCGESIIKQTDLSRYAILEGGQSLGTLTWIPSIVGLSLIRDRREGFL